MTQPAPLPLDELTRLDRLRSLAVLDTAAEPLFDALTRAAAKVAGVPIALVSLIDVDRQWFKSNVGLPDVSETPRDVAFCAHAILHEGVFEVRDSAQDARFADNPLVTGDPNIRFYAGAPISLRDGQRMGTLCVIDRTPRELTADQRSILQDLARAAGEALDQRAGALQRNSALEREAQALHLRDAERDRLLNIVDGTRAGTWEWNIQTDELRINGRWAELVGENSTDLAPTTFETWRSRIHVDDWERARMLMDEQLADRADFFDDEMRLRHKQGQWVWVHCRGRVAEWTEDGSPLWMYGTLVDVSARKAAEQRLRESESFLDRTGRVAGVGGWEVDLQSRQLTWSDETCRIHELPTDYRPSIPEALSFFPAPGREALQQAIDRAMTSGMGWELELPFVTSTGRALWVRIAASVEREGDKPRWLVGALQDVTVRRKAIDALAVTERRFRKLFEHSLGLICTHDLDGIILSANPAAARELGYTVAQLLGRSLGDFMRPNHRHLFQEYLSRIVLNRNDAGLLFMVTSDGGTRVWQYDNALDDDGEEPFILGYAQDVTEAQREARELRDWSIRDPLTGCFNRRYLAEIVARMRDGDHWGCIAVDLDRFKQINDTFGHDRGDQVLVEMGTFLKGHVRPADVVVRSGGDEFLVLLHGADEAATNRAVQRIVGEAARAPVGFTVGAAVRYGSMPFDGVLKAADEKLYAARAGRYAVGAR